MDQEEPDIGRFQPKGDPNEPREPFLPDEMLEPSYEAEVPSLKALHVPKAPVTKEGLKNFLIELKPIVEDIEEMSRKDQHLLAKHLQDVKNGVHASGLSDTVTRTFEKLVDHFYGLLVHSQPVDKQMVLENISELENSL